MNINEFIEEYSGSPIDLQEMAELCQSNLDDEDDSDLKELATEYLEAISAFRDAMSEAGIELG